MQKVLAVSHCILNKCAKVEQQECELAQEYEMRRQLLMQAIQRDIQLLQMPCPEFMLYGAKRWGHVKNQFSNPFFRKSCRELFQPIMLQLQEYANNPERFQVLGIVSVEGSPSCGKKLTCTGVWGGELSNISLVEQKVNQLQMSKEPGVFMEEITAVLQQEGLKIPILTMEQAIQCIQKS